ncbi:prepilin-type N-terminal cleavage/methylation domain-containing protein [Diplocloster hominis]|uniref:prepilin-type N-terminal cleavage/methylation domain-containing protein n=1 Tax=Diplocloster hominis TaxID=3079010 RepID=UPI0031BA3797
MIVKRKNDGFTLTEMIVVLVIIVILIALLVPTLTGYIDKAAKRACEANKASLRRDLNLVEIDEKLGGKLDVAGLQDLAKKSDYKCAQGGVYDVTRASDGDIMVTCKKHDVNYNFNMSGALAYAMANNPELDALIQSYIKGNKNIDSSSQTGKAYESVLAALKNLGFDPGLQNVGTWSLQAYSTGYLFYWTTEDISAKSPGDKVKVLRYNSLRQTYTAGYVTVGTTSISASDSSTGTAVTYNILGRGDANWSEYTDIKQTDKDKKDYDTIYDVFQQMN